MSEGATIYPSKRDVWLAALVWAAVIVMLLEVRNLWRDPGPDPLRWAISGVLIAAAALALWVLYSTGYTLADRELRIRSGPLRWRIPLDSITEVFPTRSPLSSPACSLDRLCVRYPGSGAGILISPRDKTSFLDDLALRSPGLVRDGNRLARGAVPGS